MKKEFITLNCLNKTDRDIAAYPITFGVPLKAGEVREGNALAIRSANGKSLPLQTRPLQYHADGSVAWMLLDFTASFAKNESVALSLVEGKGVATRGLTVSDTAKGVVVTSSHYKVRISREEFSLFDSWLVAGKEQIAPGSDVVIEDTNGKRFYGSNGEFTVKVCEVGSIRVEVEVEGRHTAGDGAELLSYRLRYTFRRDDPCIKLSYAFTNREMPEQGIKASQIRLIMPTKVGRGSEHLLRQSNTGLEWFSELRRVKENVEILATKAMHEAAKTRYGNAAEGKVVVRNLDNFNEKPGEYPYYLRPGNIRADYNGGLRSCYPYIGINGTGSSLLAWFSEMDVNFPKGVAADRGVLTFDIWPAWAGDVQVRRGQTKEHDIFIGCFGEPNTHEMLEGVYFDHEFLGMGVNGNAAVPIEVKFDAAYIRETEVFDMHRFLPFDEARYVRIEEKLNSYTGNAAGSRGMFDYGDSVTPDRSSAHNNENDAILWGIREYYRRRNWNLLVGALAKARHNAHVDFIAFDPDPLREGTMPAHCPEHTDGAAYPSHM
ncbi:MAG: hypothetical protein GX230_02945 [Lentisphaerae bacterium]|nr:hypothetical protein [Lentisphaerota bacterium]